MCDSVKLSSLLAKGLGPPSLPLHRATAPAQFSFFFFKSPAAPRDLPSSPPRRSPDPRLTLRRELAQAAHPLLRRAAVVFDDRLDLAAGEHAAAGVDVFHRHLRPAHDELAREGVARDRKSVV